MQAFVCAFDGFSVAIPMGLVASLSSLAGGEAGAQRGMVERDGESGDIRVSLPLLLGRPREGVRHGVALRCPGGGGRVVLLCPEVALSGEIPDGEFHPAPRALKSARFSALFSGIRCEGGALLLLDAERLGAAARLARKGEAKG